MGKKEKIQLVMIGVVVLITALVLLLKDSGAKETEGILITRPESGSEETALLLKTDDTEVLFDFEVKARTKTPEEIDEAFGKTVRHLERMLNPEGKDENVVTDSMVLPQTVEETGATIRWASSDEDVIKRDGTILREGLAESCQVDLQARITLEGECREFWFSVIVPPYPEGSNEALIYEAKKALWGLENETAEGENFYLPEEIQGVTVALPAGDFSVGAVLAAAAVLLPVMILAAKRQEKENEKKERERVFLEAYPRLVTKLTLYVGAGLSLRGAWERIGAECRNKADVKKTKNGVSEEILVLVGELKNGKSEAGVYEAFGRRIGLKPYLRLASLLISQLQKGSGGLREGLETEVRLAWELQREQAEKKGEEAQTKLLFPMMGMLFLVLAIVMFPAFFSMSI